MFRFLFSYGVMFIAPILGAGCLLSLHEWLGGEREVLLAVASVTIAGTLLSLPLIPVEWLWRFLLMDFIPMSLIMGCIASKIQAMSPSRRKTYIYILFLLYLSLLVLQAVYVSRSFGPIITGPTISEDEYDELEAIGAIIHPGSVVVGDPRYPYWLQYNARCSISLRVSTDLWQNYKQVLVLIYKSPPPPPPPPAERVMPRAEQPPPPPPIPRIPPNSKLLFEGNHFILYEQSHP